MIELPRATVPPWLKIAPPIPDPAAARVGPGVPMLRLLAPYPPPKPAGPPPPPPAPPSATPLVSVRFWRVRLPAAVTWNNRYAAPPSRVIVSPVPWMVTGLMTIRAVGPTGWGTATILAERLMNVERLIVP